MKWNGEGVVEIEGGCVCLYVRARRNDGAYLLTRSQVYDDRGRREFEIVTKNFENRFINTMDRYLWIGKLCDA